MRKCSLVEVFVNGAKVQLSKQGRAVPGCRWAVSERAGIWQCDTEDRLGWRGKVMLVTDVESSLIQTKRRRQSEAWEGKAGG
jgi:hypothetical protein